MKKIMITGGTGFIGRNLKEQLQGSYEIFAPSRAELDILDQYKVEQILKTNAFDVVIHAATQNASRNAREGLNAVLERNLRMFFNLERCCGYYGKMLYYGSGAEYDIKNYRPNMKETYFDEHIPKDDYGFSKYIMSKSAAYSPNIYDLRLFGVFGPYEDWEIRFISNACCKVLFDMPITIRKNVVFDYMYIDDLVGITSWFCENTPKEKHYNITTGYRSDLKSIAEKIRSISGRKLDIRIEEEGLKPEYSGDNGKLLSEMGKYLFMSLDEAIEKLYYWYSKNINLIDRQKLVFDK